MAVRRYSSDKEFISFSWAEGSGSQKCPRAGNAWVCWLMGICVVHVAKVGLYVTIFSLPPLVTSLSDPWFILESMHFHWSWLPKSTKIDCRRGGTLDIARTHGPPKGHSTYTNMKNMRGIKISLRTGWWLGIKCLKSLLRRMTMIRKEVEKYSCRVSFCFQGC